MTGTETSFVSSTDGVQVAVHDFGGRGRLLLFCHATGFCANTWQPMIELLQDRFHCVAIDFRAHGRTQLPDGVALAWNGMADDLTAVVQALSPGQPTLAVGHSMGGTSIILAEAARPGLFERAWAYEPILLRHAPVLVGDDGPEIAKATRARRATFGSAQEAFDRYAGRPPLGLLDHRALRAYVEHGFRPLDDGTITLRCRPEQEASVFEHHNTGAFDRVAELTMPFLIGAGGDPDGPAQWVHEAASLHGGLHVVDYPDLTHFGPLQEPDRLGADVALFFAGEVGASTEPVSAPASDAEAKGS